MNTIKHFFLLTLFISMTGCSSEDKPIVAEEAPSILKFDINGVEAYNGNVTAFKTENKISVNSTFDFDTSGRLAFFALYLPIENSSDIRTFTSFKYLNSNYFTFNLETIDEVNKRVKGAFLGYLYANPTDLNSEKKYVNGSFDLKYSDLVPGVFGLKNEAKINGNEWVKLYRESSNMGGTYTHKITYEDYSDNEYKITLNIDLPNYSSTIPAVTYNFGNTDVSNNVRIAKFDFLTGNIINYNTVGTFAITKYENFIMSGNYSFTAVNPNNPSDIIVVTDGVFKLVNKYNN